MHLQIAIFGGKEKMKEHNFIEVEHDNGDFDAVSVTPETMAALLAFAEAAGKDPTDVLTDAVTE